MFSEKVRAIDPKIILFGVGSLWNDDGLFDDLKYSDHEEICSSILSVLGAFERGLKQEILPAFSELKDGWGIEIKEIKRDLSAFKKSKFSHDLSMLTNDSKLGEIFSKSSKAETEASIFAEALSLLGIRTKPLSLVKTIAKIRTFAAEYKKEVARVNFQTPLRKGRD